MSVAVCRYPPQTEKNSRRRQNIMCLIFQYWVKTTERSVLHVGIISKVYRIHQEQNIQPLEC